MSYTSFVAALSGLSVAGVRRTYNAPPVQLSTADLPALFTTLPQGNTAIDTLGGTTGLRSMSCMVVVAIEPVKQSMQLTNYTATMTMLDAVESTLKAAAASNRVIDRWTLEATETPIGDSLYWAIVATVEGSEES